MSGTRSPSSTPPLPLLLLLSLTVLHLLSPLTTTSAQSPPEDLTILSIQGDGTCVNVGGIAVNCTMPFTLTLTVVHLTVPVEAYGCYLRLRTASGMIVGRTEWYNPAVSNATDTSIPFVIGAGGVSSYPFSTLLNVSLVDVRDDIVILQSPFTAAFSLSPWPVPVITSVSGCGYSNDSLVTTGCVADVDVLTLTGTGFYLLEWFTIVTQTSDLGRRSSCCYTGDSPGISIVNDSFVTLTLLDSFGFFLAEHYSGVMISISIRLQNAYVVGPFNITLAAPPAPIFTSWSVPGVDPVVINGTDRYLGCVPGVSQFALVGKYLFNGTLTVGGVVCDTTPYARLSDALRCNLPLIEPNVNGTLYDVQFMDAVGQLTLPAIIGFTDKPSLFSVAQCWSDGGFFTPYGGTPPSRCAAGDTIYLYGRAMTMASLTLLNVTLTAYYGEPAPLTLNCLNLTVVNDSLITCVLPSTMDSTVLGQPVLVQSVWSGQYLSNVLSSYLYDFLGSPRIHSIVTSSGRGSDLSTGLALTGCQPGDVLTMTGAQFNSTFDWTVTSISVDSVNPSWYCSPLTIKSTTLATCQLPTLDEAPFLQSTQSYRVLMIPTTRTQQLLILSSNAFSISFNLASPSSSSTASAAGSTGSDVGGGGSESTETAIIASVVVVVVVVLLLAMSGGWWWYRVSSRSRRGGRGAEGNREVRESGWGSDSSGMSSRKWAKMSSAITGKGADRELNEA